MVVKFADISQRGWKNSGTRGNSGTPPGIVEKIVAHVQLFIYVTFEA